MAPPPKATTRSTSPAERGLVHEAPTPARDRGGSVDPGVAVNRGVAVDPGMDLDRGVDLGSVADESGNQWYTDETGRTWVWEAGAQNWRLISGAADAIRVEERAPMTDAEREWTSRNDAYRRFVRAPARQFGQAGVMGGQPRVVAKIVSKVISNDYLNLGALDPTGTANDLARQWEEAEDEYKASAERPGADADADAEAKALHAAGELFQMPVVVASDEKLEKEKEKEQAMAIVAGTKSVSPPARIGRFINAVVDAYRDELVKARTAEPTATPQRLGMLAESQTLARVPDLARARGLNPGYIWTGNFPVGVTGPRGGALSAEMGSPKYGFIIELKKSPKAVKGYQAFGHQVAADYAVNFPKGGVYVRVIGESFKPGQGVYRREMGGGDGEGKPKPKPRPPRKPRLRLK